MNLINYVIGDATDPKGDGEKIIIHVCNDLHIWGSGFVMSLSAKCNQPEKAYKNAPAILGHVSYANYLGNGDVIVANCVAQRGISKDFMGNPPIRYEALEDCLAQVAEYALKNNASIHGPRLGSDRAGGRWDIIEKILIRTLVKKGIPVTIYDLEE